MNIVIPEEEMQAAYDAVKDLAIDEVNLRVLLVYELREYYEESKLTEHRVIKQYGRVNETFSEFRPAIEINRAKQAVVHQLVREWVENATNH